MWPKLQALADALSMSNGDLLQIARRIACDDSLRTVDLLTAAERALLMSELRQLEDARGVVA